MKRFTCNPEDAPLGPGMSWPPDEVLVPYPQRTHILGFWAQGPYFTRPLGYFDAKGVSLNFSVESL